MTLSFGAEECLKAICHLGVHDRPVPLAALAERLDISVVSANEMCPAPDSSAATGCGSTF
jgi:Mn-dependent DtxR family transcriptional regulator